MQATSDEALTLAAQSLGAALQQQGLQLATAESCTGGWVCKAITDIAGSSQWFQGGLVTYANSMKMALLGVTGMSLQQHGAVSEAVAREMLLGLMASLDADVGLAITGIAGPDGGTAEKPVGTVWFAWMRRGAPLETVCEQFPGGREAVRRQAVLFALQGLRGLLG